MTNVRVAIVGLWLGLTLLTAGCSGDGANGTSDGTSVGNGFILDMQADLSEAVALTRSVGDGRSGEPELNLKKVTRHNTLANVLEGPHKIFHYKETPNHIIAQVLIEEQGRRCYLIAIPKVRGRTPVYCLSREMLTPNSDQKKSRPAFDVLGSEVYFAHVELHYDYVDYRNSNQITELRHWDGVSEKTTTITRTDSLNNHNSYIEQVFASKTNENLCYNFSGNSSGFGHVESSRKHLICRKGKKERWFRVENVAVSEASLRLDNHILISQEDEYGGSDVFHKLNLHTLATEERKGRIPKTHDFDLRDGGFIGRGDAYPGKVVYCVDRNGDSKEVVTSNTDTPLVRIGGYAWLFASQALYRISLSDCELDSHNFMPKNMFQITGLSYLFGDMLRVNGSDAISGLTTTAYVDDKGTTLLTRPVEEVTIEHPIEIKWSY